MRTNYSDYTSDYAEGIYLDRHLTDLTKFLCCIMVALHHYSQYALSNNISHNIVYRLFSTQGGYLGVGIFFFLSGYGLIKSDLLNHLSFFSFIKKRLIKVYIPVLLVTTMWLPTRSYFLKESIEWQDIAGILWNWKDAVLWFIRTILELYIVFYLYSFIRIKFKTQTKRLILCFSFFIISVIIAIYTESLHTLSTPLFFLGISIGEFGIMRKVFRNTILVGCFLVVVSLLCYLSRHNMFAIHGLFNYYVIFISLWICSHWKLSIPKCIGNSAFDVYLVHNKVLIVSRELLPVVPIGEFIIVTFVVTIIFYNIRMLLKV